MELPEHLRSLVGELGDSLVQALTQDEHCRELATQIQQEGYDLYLLLEATLALHKRQEEGLEPRDRVEAPEWSESDKTFLKTFRISGD